MRVKVPRIFVSLANNGVELLVPTAIMFFVARTYSSQEVGSWMVFVAICVFANKFREAFVQAAMVREAAKEEMFFIALKAGLILSFLIESLLSSIMLFIAAMNFLPHLRQFFLLYPIYGFGMAVYRWQAASHQVSQDIYKMVAASLVFLTTSLICLLWLYYGNQYGISSIIIIQGLSYLAGGVAGIFMLPLSRLGASKINKNVLLSFIEFGKYGLFRDFFGTFSARISIFLTAGWISMSQTASLGIVQRLTQLISMPSVASQMLFFPLVCKLANNNQFVEIKEAYEENVATTIASLLPIAIVFGIFAKPVLELLGNEGYGAAAPILAISIANIALLVPFGQAFGSVTNAIGKPQLNAKVVSINSVINVLLALILIWKFGLYGAVLAPAITDLIGFFWIKKILFRELGIELNRCFLRVPYIYFKWIKIFFYGLHTSLTFQRRF